MFGRMSEDKLWEKLSKDFHKHVKKGEEDSFLSSLDLHEKRLKEQMTLVEEHYDEVIGKEAHGYGNEELDSMREQKKKLVEVEAKLGDLKGEWSLKSLGRNRRKEILKEKKLLKEEKVYRKETINILKTAVRQWTPTEKDVFLNKRKRMLGSIRDWKKLTKKRIDHKEEQMKENVLLKRNKRLFRRKVR